MVPAGQAPWKRVGHSRYDRRSRGSLWREGYNRYTVEELTRPYEVTASLVGAIYLPVFTVHNAMQLTDEKCGVMRRILPGTLQERLEPGKGSY